MGTESGPTYGRTVGLACSQSRWNHCPEWLTSDPIEEEKIISETTGLARTTPFHRLLQEKIFFTKTSREFGLAFGWSGVCIPRSLCERSLPETKFLLIGSADALPFSRGCDPGIDHHLVDGVPALGNDKLQVQVG